MRIGAADVAALASIGAGAIHAAAAGIHAENPTLSRLFVLTAAAQILVGLVLLLRRGRVAAVATVARQRRRRRRLGRHPHAGISWIDGLEQSESPGFADTVCAGLGALAVVAAAVALVRHTTTVRRGNLIAPGVALGALSVVAMMAGATNVHSHDDGAAAHAHTEDGGDGGGRLARPHVGAGDGRQPPSTPTRSEPATTAHADDHADHETEPAALAWPRAWDPTAPIDFSGVDGVTAEQQERAETLAANTLRDLPAFADVTHARRRSATGRSATPRRASSTSSTSATSATTRSSTRPDRSRSCTRSTARSARWCRPCSSPRTSRSTTPSWSTGAGR